jgi:CheY-like chemotaxis protein
VQKSPVSVENCTENAGRSASVGRVTDESVTVLVYSSRADTRALVHAALGTRPHPDLPPVTYLDVATGPMVVRYLDAGTVDLAILDGEAAPVGGMGLAKQVRDEVEVCPPLLVLTGRPQDAWLADWSRADAIVSHPIDPFELGRAVTALLRQHS